MGEVGEWGKMSSKVYTLKVAAFLLLFLSAISTPLMTLWHSPSSTDWLESDGPYFCSPHVQLREHPWDQPFLLSHQRTKRKAGKGDPSPFTGEEIACTSGVSDYNNLLDTVHHSFHRVTLGIIISVRPMNPLAYLSAKTVENALSSQRGNLAGTIYR